MVSKMATNPSGTGKRRRDGYDCEFIERPKELQTDCPSCLVILREPFQVTCCGCSFCQTCIEHIQAEKIPCPSCHRAEFDTFPNKGLRRSLYSFQVRCEHKKRGCEWTGELGEMDRHLNLNPELGKQLTGCVFAAVACAYCCAYFQRRYVRAHQAESCPQRPFSCNYCDYKAAYEDVVNNHWRVCKCYPVPCPNRCGTNLERQKVEMHICMQCPFTVVSCDFHDAGCDVQLARKDRPTHSAESLATHISLLTAQTQRMAAGSGTQDPAGLAEHLLPHLSLLTLHNQQLTRLTIQLKGSLEESQRTINQLRKEIAQLRKGKGEEIKKLETSLQVAMTESESLKPEMAELRVKQDEDGSSLETLKQEMAEQRVKQDEDRSSLETMQRYTGVFPIKLMMTNFAEMKGNHGQWYSPAFYTYPQRYKMCLRVVADGYGDGEGTHVSVFAHLMQGERGDDLKMPLQGRITVAMLNQLEDNNHATETIRFTETKESKYTSGLTEEEIQWGWPTFIAHTKLDYNPTKNCQYLKYNRLHFKIVTVELIASHR